MLQAFALCLLLLALGYLARRLGRFPDHASDVLNRFVVEVCVPALVLRLIPTLTLRFELLALAIVPWLLVGFTALVVRLVAPALHLDAKARAALFLCTAIGNTSFLGFPLCSALLGEASIPLAAVYDQLGSFMILSTVGIITIARAASQGSPSFRELGTRIVTFPPFIALLLALVPWTHPAWFDEVLARIGAALVPVVFFSVGLRTRLSPPRELRAFGFALFYKLLLTPCLVLGVASLLRVSDPVRAVLVLESGMPTSITAGALAMAYGLAPELAASCVAFGIMASLLTAPAWAYVLTAL